MVICRPSIKGSASTLAIGAVSALTRCKQLVADVLVRHLAAAEPQRHLHLVALVEEAAHRAHLHFVVVVVDAGPELDFLDLDHLLALARLGRLLLLEEAVFPEIEDLADRRRGVGNDFDQIERGFFRELLRVGEIDDAAILAVGVDELNLNCADVAIDPRPAFLRRRDGLHGTTNGHSPVSACAAP